MPDILRIPEMPGIPRILEMFGIPRIPGMPGIPRIPEIPRILGIPGIPRIPGIPWYCSTHSNNVYTQERSIMQFMTLKQKFANPQQNNKLDIN